MNPIKLHKRFAEQGLDVIVSNVGEDSSLGTTKKLVFMVERADEHKRKFMQVCRRMGALSQVFPTHAFLYFCINN